VAEDASALAVEEPGDIQLDISTLRSDLVEVVLVSCKLIQDTIDSVFQLLSRPLTFDETRRPIAFRPRTF
jgi:hypothetical protein